MARYEHTGNAAATTLSSAITSSSTPLNITSATGWPTGAVGAFWVTIDAGTASEEKVLITSRTGTALTVSTRGADSTTATSHANGAAIIHSFSATEADAANAHVEATTGHGATGAVVGTTNTQTLTNKTLTAPTLTSPVVDQFGTASGLGAAWTAFTPTLTNFAATITMARYKQIGKTVHYVMCLSLTAAPTGSMRFSLPVAIEPSWDIAAGPVIGAVAAYDAAPGAYRLGTATYDSTTNAGMIASDTAGANWNATTPITWASGDTIQINGTYEAV